MRQTIRLCWLHVNPKPLVVVALALSADGHTLAAGAIGEDSAATGVSGDEADDAAAQAGAAYAGSSLRLRKDVSFTLLGSEREHEPRSEKSEV